MTFEAWSKIHDYCMSKPCVYESRPFGKFPVCYRISGRIFCQLNAEKEWYKVTLKTNPEAAAFYRSAYPGIIVRGYHCPPVQQPYWNTISLPEVEESLVFQIIDEAYLEVITHLPKKEQTRIPQKATYTFRKTDGKNHDFRKLCEMLDESLDEMVGGEFDRSCYAEFNMLDRIQDVIVIYDGKIPIGAGGYRFYDNETVEMKRVFIKDKYRRVGLGRDLMLRLEADARIRNFRYAVLETGDPLVAASALYRKCGYKVIPNYGPYVNMPESVCMQKKL